MGNKENPAEYAVSPELQRKLNEIHKIGLEGRKIISEIDDPAALHELSKLTQTEMDKLFDRPTIWQRILKLFGSTQP